MKQAPVQVAALWRYIPIFIAVYVSRRFLYPVVGYAVVGYFDCDASPAFNAFTICSAAWNK